MSAIMSMLAALTSGVRLHSSQAMEGLGRALVAEKFSRGGVLGLVGDLGAGKTTLVRGMAAALGIDNITSPSFNYYLLYKGKIPLLHLDAYRLNSPEEYPSLMIDELLTPETLFVIEWPEKMGGFLPQSAMLLEIKIVGEGVHEARIISPSPPPA